jgi:hypothetical protein
MEELIAGKVHFTEIRGCQEYDCYRVPFSDPKQCSREVDALSYARSATARFRTEGTKMKTRAKNIHQNKLQQSPIRAPDDSLVMGIR